MGAATLLAAARWGNFGDRWIGQQSGFAIAGYQEHPKLKVADLKTVDLKAAAATVATPKAADLKAVEPIPAKMFNPPSQAIAPTAISGATSSAKAIGTTKVVVKLSDRRLYLYQNGQVLGRYEIAVGQAGWETPTGTFQVLDKEQNPTWIHPITGITVPAGADNPLGKAWIGFWTDGKSEIGFHGTNQEELLGQAVSHGCLRMRNQDIEAVYAKVSEGTPVIVQE